MLLLLAACTEPIGVRPRPSPGAGSGDSATSVTGDTGHTGAAEPAPTGDTGATGLPTADTGAVGPCPEEMAFVGIACVDRWEAHLEGWSPYEVPAGGRAVSAEGAVPQAYVSQPVAAAACAEAGKRLCSLEEWTRACGGPDGTTWPYGDAYDADACNDTRAVHPVIELFGAAADWSNEQMNDPRLNQLPDSLDPAGANPGCESAEGVFDLHGNLHEWIDDPGGTFKGGFYVDAVLNGPGCTYTTTAHTAGYHDYSTGFRCCKEAWAE